MLSKHKSVKKISMRGRFSYAMGNSQNLVHERNELCKPKPITHQPVKQFEAVCSIRFAGSAANAASFI